VELTTAFVNCCRLPGYAAIDSPSDGAFRARLCIGVIRVQTATCDSLIDDVLHGRKTPAQVEAEAAALALGPLAVRPDCAAFNPMREESWTMPMTVAWIASRSIEAVTQQWDAYRAECREWHYQKWRVGLDGPVYEGFALERARVASVTMLTLMEAIDNANLRNFLSTPVNDAKEVLWAALMDGLLSATCLVGQSRARQKVAPERWIEATTDEHRGHELLRVFTAEGGREEYYGVLVPRKAVLSLWPNRELTLERARDEETTPLGDGYMPLSCAVQWVASEGNVKDPEGVLDDEWLAAYKKLVASLSSGSLSAIGLHRGQMEPIPQHKFALCPVHPAWLDYGLPKYTGMYLRAWIYTDEDNWRDGFNDALMNAGVVHWERLSVAKDHVRRLWPFHLGRPTTTGGPGRPSSMHLVAVEHDDRMVRGVANTSLKAEADELARWLAAKHPGSPPATAKTIENNIREAHRGYHPDAPKK
jgi:hypothetical protein